MCYYCMSDKGECNEERYGELTKCQYEDEDAEHYGNACIVGHTGKQTHVMSILHLCLI